MYSKRSGLIIGFHGCDKTVQKETGKNKFEAEIRDEDGKIVFKYDDALLKNDKMIQNEHDIPGLIELLINKNKIKRGDILEPSDI